MSGLERNMGEWSPGAHEEWLPKPGVVGSVENLEHVLGVNLKPPEGHIVTIKLIGGVPGMENYPELSAHLNRYLTRYEPEAVLKQEQWLWTTDNREEAMAVPFEVAMNLLKKSIGTRPDGKPDRPITAYHVELKRVEVPA